MTVITGHCIPSGLLLHRKTAPAPRSLQLRAHALGCSQSEEQPDAAPACTPPPEMILMAASCARTLLAVSAVSSILAHPAAAADRTWLPRRHYRRIDDHRKREVDLGRHMKVGRHMFTHMSLTCAPASHTDMLGLPTGGEEGGGLHRRAGRHTGATEILGSHARHSRVSFAFKDTLERP